MTNGRLTRKQYVLMSCAVFSMHFGASCLLYPMTWGRQSGSAVLPAFAGVFLTAILLPLLGYLALARSNLSFLQMARRGPRRLGLAFCCIAVLVNGPIYVIPRMSAAAWQAVVQFLGSCADKRIVSLSFHGIYYAAVCWFLSSRAKTMERLGKILSPLLITIVAAVIIKGCLAPVSVEAAPKTYSEPAFVYGLLQGYATGDLLCSLMFGAVIINGFHTPKAHAVQLQKQVLLVGASGLGILMLAHLGHMLVGARHTGGSELTFAALYMQVVVELFGKTGGLLFLIGLIAAALSAAVGIGAASVEFFAAQWSERVSYRWMVRILCVVSFAISCVGLEKIIAVMGPVLSACYPVAIVLVAYFAFVPRIEDPRFARGLRAATICAAVFSVLNVLSVYNQTFGLQWTTYETVFLALPLGKYELSWLPASAFAFLAGVLSKKDKTVSDTK